MENSTKAVRPIPLFTPEIRGNAWQYVKDCLDTTWVSSVGGYVDKFESRIAEQVGVKHAVATSCGTAALHTALITMGIEANDEVLVSTLTFIASANSIRYCGAWPVFIDAEPRHWQMDPELVEQFLTRRCHWENGELRNRSSGRRVRAIMPVHVLGHPVDIDPIMDLARRFNLKVIEDAAEGLGCKYKGRPVGGLADIGCISFNGNKLITTGGGGVVLTNQTHIAERVRSLTTQAKSHPIEYTHSEVGYNYRLTNMQAALGCAQLECLPDFLIAKQRTAQAYKALLRDIPGISFYAASPQADCTYWMNTIRVDATQFGMDSRSLLRELQSQDIQTRPLWQPMHASPAHRGCESVITGTADALAAECLNVPSSVGLTDTDVDRVCDQIRRIQHSSKLPMKVLAA